MKRFWKTVSIANDDRGWTVSLDDRPIRTPAREPLNVPTQALAEAIAGEWRGISETVDPRAMPLTGLANAAIDRVAPDRPGFALGIAPYGESDLLCYRADGPPKLVELQRDAWDPLLAWARRRFDVDFVTTQGLAHVAQPAATLERFRHAVAALDDFELAGLSPLVTIGGSLVAGVAVQEKAIAVDQAWQAVSLDDHWQLEQWGSDAEAETALARRERDFVAAARFLELLD